jgi:glycosyltransferase involved in cell wall biosynthesis
VDAVCIGHVARYDPMKDHAGFFKAAQMISQHHPDTLFILAGKNITWDNNELVNMIKMAQLEEKVYLLGERSDIFNVMNSLNIFCSTSAFGEGFPNVVGEAMACGVPCVVTDVGSSALIVGSTGFVVPPGQSMAFFKGIKSLLTISDDQRVTKGQKARQRIETKFSIGHITKEYEAIYKNLLKIE